MNITKLHYFIEAARYGSFSEAARQLYTSQSNLSKQISLLESELNLKLFRRTNRSVFLTKAGQYMFDELKDVPTLVTDVCTRAKALDRAASDRICIGILKSRAFNQVLSPLYGALSSAFPYAEFELEYTDFGQLRSGFDTSGFDIIITKSYELSEMDRAVEFRRLYTVSSAVLTSRTSPYSESESLKLSDLQDAEFIIMEQAEAPGYFRNFMNVCAGAGIKPNIVRQTNHVESLVMYASNGVGVAWADLDAPVPDFSLARVIEVTDAPPVDMVAVWHRDRRMDQHQEIADMIADYLDQ